MTSMLYIKLKNLMMETVCSYKTLVSKAVLLHTMEVLGGEEA
jgi:hypothetical protein